MNQNEIKTDGEAELSAAPLLDTWSEVDASVVMKANDAFREMCISSLVSDEHNKPTKVFQWVFGLPFGHGVVRLQDRVAKRNSVGRPVSKSNLHGLLVKDSAVRQPCSDNCLLKYIALPFKFLSAFVHRLQGDVSKKGDYLQRSPRLTVGKGVAHD